MLDPSLFSYDSHIDARTIRARVLLVTLGSFEMCIRDRVCTQRAALPLGRVHTPTSSARSNHARSVSW